MKKRLGFVSNSSSSSYIITGKPLTVNDLADIRDNPEKYNNPCWFSGRDLGEGFDRIELTPKIINLIFNNKLAWDRQITDGQLIDVTNMKDTDYYDDWSTGYGNDNVKPEELVDPSLVVIELDISYHAVKNDSAAFKYYYIDEDN